MIEENRAKIHFLADLLAGEVAGRTRDEQVTMLNKNAVFGFEFASVGKLVYDKALAAGIGKEIPSEWFSQTSPP